MQNVLPPLSGEPGAIRAELAAARSLLLRQYVGLDTHTLESRQFWPGATPTVALARIARRDDRAACAVESLFGRVGQRAEMPITGAHVVEALRAFLGARARLLSALAAHHRNGVPPPEALSILTLCRDHDRRWAERLEGWKEEQHIPLEAGPVAILLAADRAARKELLTSLALVPPEARQAWRRELLTLASGELTLLHGLTAPAEFMHPVEPDLSWEATWRLFHDTHHALLGALEAPAQNSAGPAAGRINVYRLLTRALDRDRALALTVRARIPGPTPTGARSQPAAPGTHTRLPGSGMMPSPRD